MRPRARPEKIGLTMLLPDHPIETAADARRRLDDLRFELAIAGPSGMSLDAAYVQEIQDDISASEELFVGLAVTEIASLRAQLGTPLLG